MDTYEKAYEEALEKAKYWHKEGYGKGCQEVVEDIFPELKESEGEMIRKGIIDFFWKEKIFLQEAHASVENNPKYHFVMDAIAWLEKQGEKDRFIKEEIECIKGYRENAIKKLEEFEKQGERKVADKIESKFNIGDWVVYDHRPYQVVELPKEGYINLGLKENGKIEFAPSTYCRHWTIQDAKDGDVLSYVTDEEDLWIMIYRSLYEPYEGHVHYHALLVNDNFSDKGTCCICINDLKPATKEQRDLLFQKMKEASYEWSDKDRKLIKIVK